MALTTEDLDRLDKAIASQQLEVQMDGRRVRYRDMSELITARQHVAQQLAAGRGTGIRRFRFATLRGD